MVVGNDATSSIATYVTALSSHGQTLHACDLRDPEEHVPFFKIADDGRVTRSAAFCAATRSTSCRSSGTCCAAT